jgi:hypothetical protein
VFHAEAWRTPEYCANIFSKFRRRDPRIAVFERRRGGTVTSSLISSTVFEVQKAIFQSWNLLVFFFFLIDGSHDPRRVARTDGPRGLRR